MSGLVAIIAHDRAGSVSEAEVNDLTDAYESLRGTGRRCFAAAGRRARAVQIDTTDGEPAGLQYEGRSWAMWSGVIHSDRPVLKARLDELDGQFGLILYDEHADEVRVVGDPLGMHALYVATQADRTYVSTSVLALAKHLHARPSRLGLHGFLLAGYHFGTMTNWEGLERVDPGTSFRFTETHPEKEVYWRPHVDQEVARLSFPQAVDHCIEVATETYGRYFAGRPPAWADLTGGYDSRLLCLLLRRAGVEFRTNTRDTSDGVEERIAGELARVGGWEWFRPSYPADWPEILPTMLQTALAWGDANLEVLQLSRVLWAHAQLAHRQRGLLSAGGGEHFQYAAWKSEFLRAGRTTQVNFDNWVTMRLVPPVATSILASEPLDEVRADFRRRMAARVECHRSELNTMQLDILYAYKGTGHFGAYRSADGGVIQAELPFYFKPVFTAAVSTKYTYRNGHRLLRHMIERLDPKIAALTTTRGGPAQPWRAGNLHRFLPYYGSLGVKGVNKIAAKRFGRALPAERALFPWRTAVHRSVVDHLQDDVGWDLASLRSQALYDRDQLATFLARAGTEDFQQDALLGRFLTVELALQAVDASLE